MFEKPFFAQRKKSIKIKPSEINKVKSENQNNLSSDKFIKYS